MPETLTIPKILRRELPFELLETAPQYLEFSFSSEYAVEREFGREILSHSPGAPDFSRISGNACPWLFNHNRDQYLGRITRAWIRDGKGVCRAEWSSASEIEGSWAWTLRQDIERGILPNTSFLYHINRLERGQNKGDMVATSWTPYEISTVTIPADPTVGISRALEEDGTISVPLFKSTMEGTELGGTMEITNEEKREQGQEAPNAAEQERLRIRSIVQLCKRHALGEQIENQLIDSGASIDDARRTALERLEAQPPVAAPLGLSKREQKSYSLIRAVEAFLNKDWSKAGFELECSRTIAEQSGRQPTGFFVPIGDLSINQEAAQRARGVMGQRTPLVTGTPTAAGNLIETTLDSASFIEILRNNILISQMGARMLTGLNGNLDVPRQTGTGTAYWVAEGSGPTESNATFDLVQFRPKTVGALASMTRTMMLQSSIDIEMLVREDMTQVIARELDRVAIDGSGASNQPRGILNTSGIGSVAMGAAGAALTNLDPLIDLETQVAIANADFGNLYYMTNPKVVGALKKLKATTGEYLWNGYEQALGAAVPGSINGYPVGRTNQVPSNKTKSTGSNLSCLIFGNFSDLWIGMWGVLDVLPNAYGAGYAAGSIELRALQTCDVQLARPTSFGAITDIVTA